MTGLTRRGFLAAVSGLAATWAVSVADLGRTLASTVAPGDGMTTLRATIRRRSTGGPTYRTLVTAPGEPYVVRTDVLRREPAAARQTDRRSLAYLGHFSDIHLIDAQSPGRLEPMIALNRSAWGGAFRPQDNLTVHVLAAMVAAMRDVRYSPLTGAAMSAAFVTGDSADMHNSLELGWYISALDGAEITANSGAAGVYEGVQAWDDTPFAYHPEDPSSDPYGERGFPRVPGLLSASVTVPARSPGLPVPWYAVYGNHDTLLLGTFRIDDAWRRFAVGDRKATSWPATGTSWLSGFASDASPMQQAIDALTGGRQSPGLRAVTPDPARRVFERLDFVRAHLTSPAVPGPVGHGFTPADLAESRTWWEADVGRHLRVFGLDTCNNVAGPDGAVPEEQFVWLQARLAQAQAESRLVIVLSHHNSATLENGATPVIGPSQRLYGAEEFVAMLQRFPVVVAWLNGHTHINTIVGHPRDDGGGFWEITTASCVDFPQQQQVVELIDNLDGTMSIFATVLDHASPPEPGAGFTAQTLASWSREFAANDWAEDPLMRLGSPLDRNVELLLPAPFDLSSITDAALEAEQAVARARLLADERRGAP